MKSVRRLLLSGVLALSSVIPMHENQTGVPFVAGYMASGYCSGYATRAAERLFGNEFERADAWNLRYRNNILPFSYSDLREGDLIGIFYPKSSHNDRRDEEGNQVSYTHVALYTGNREILHNFGGPVRENLEDFLERTNSEAREIIRAGGR